MSTRSERAALREDAARLLGEMGGSASEVACALYLMGVAVPRLDSRQASVARYLHAIVAGDPRVAGLTVTRRWLVIKTERRWRSTIRVRLPRPIRQFSEVVDRPRPHRDVLVWLDDDAS